MTIGDRIRQAREALGLTQPALARRVGVTKSAVNQWEHGQTKRLEGENLLRCARALGVSPDWLLSGKGPMRPDRVQEPHRAYRVSGVRCLPLLDYVQAGRPRDAIAAMESGVGAVSVPIASDLAAELGPYAFGLVVRGDHMLPFFRPGDVIIIDPDAALRPGDIVLAKLEREELPTLGKYRARGDDENGAMAFELAPLNEDYPTVLVNARNPGEIIGPVLEHRRRLR